MLQKNQVMAILLRPEENMGGEKKTNGCANQVEEEHNRTESIFLLNHLKINVPVRLSDDALRIGHRSTPSLVLLCLVFNI